MSFITGVDVSEYQGRMDWAKCAGAGAAFAFCRATYAKIDGTLRVDEQFPANAGSAPRHSLTGYYHFFRPQYNAVEQADFFCSQVEDKEMQLPPVIDVEYDGGVPPDALASAAKGYIDRIEALMSRTPIIYTRGGFWNRSVGNPDWASAYPLWIARYNPDIQHPWEDGKFKPDSWDDWQFWQWSADRNGRGREFGAVSDDIDINRWNGTLDELKVFADESILQEPEWIKVRVVADALNVRSGPGAGHAKIGILKRGDVVRIYDLRRAWAKIDAGRERWVYSLYLA